MILTADDIRAMLSDVRRAEVLTDAMRVAVRPPTVDELYGAIGGLTVIRNKLLSVCVRDVEVEREEG